MRITLAVAHGLLLAVAFAGGTTADATLEIARTMQNQVCACCGRACVVLRARLMKSARVLKH